MLKAFEDLIELAKATPRQMQLNPETASMTDRMAHFRAAFSPRVKGGDKPKKKKTSSASSDKPKFTIRDLGRKLSSGGNA